MSEQSPDDPILTLKLGLLSLQFIQTNFKAGDGSNPLEQAVLQLCNQVFEETISKIETTVAIMCNKQGIRYQPMDPEQTREVAIQSLQQPGDTQVGVVTEDGKAIIDADYNEAVREGRSTKN